MRPVTWVALGVTLAALLVGEELSWRQRAAAVERTRVARRAVRPGTCRAGASGGFILSDRANVVYSVDVVGDTGRVRMAVVGRGRPNWKGRGGTPHELSSPVYPEPVHINGGGAFDTLVVVYDDLNDAAWIHARKVPLQGRSLVLVDRVDGVGGPLAVTEVLEIPPLHIPGFCDDPPGGGAVIREALERVPAVRRFGGL